MTQTFDASRRDFIKHSTVAVASTSLLGSLAPSSYASGDETIRVALVGCGGRGSGATNQALATKGPVKLVAMADAFRDRIDQSLVRLKREHPDKVDVPEDRIFVGFDAFQKAIDSGVDLVILATPPGFRPLHFEYAVQQGKHVFMEKPVAVDAPGVRRVLASAEEAKKKNLKVGVGLQRHHEEKYIETIKRIHDGEIGEIISLRCYWNQGSIWVRDRDDAHKTKLRQIVRESRGKVNKEVEKEIAAYVDKNFDSLKQKHPMTEMEYQMRNWYYFNWLCGDGIVEQHMHNVDVCNWVMGAYPDYAQGMGGRQVRTGSQFGEIFDHHVVEFAYGPKWDTATRMFSQSRQQEGCWSQVAEFVAGTKGICSVNGGWIKDTSDKTIWRHRGVTNPYQIEHDVLFDAIRNNKEFNEAENGAKSTMTCIMGRMATYSGQLVRWKDAIESQIDLVSDNLDWNTNPPTLPDENGNYPVPMPGITKAI